MKRWRKWVFAGLVVPLLLKTAPAGEISSFQAGEGGWQLGTLGIGNLDGGADFEIVVPYRNFSGQWFLDAFKWSGERLPGFPFSGGSQPINVSPTLYDLDGDGRDEILFTCGSSLVTLSGDGTVIWSAPVHSSNYIPNSGYMTTTNGFYWSTTGSLLKRLPASADFSSQVSSPIVADVNGTGTPEVISAWKIDPEPSGSGQDFNPFINDIWGSGEWGTMGETWSGGVVFHDARTGAAQYIYHLHHLLESGLALGQADADRPLEVYALNDSDSVVCFDRTQPHGFYGKGTLHGQFGRNLRLMSGSYQLGVDVYTCDLDGDGRSEVLVPTTHCRPLWTPSESILDDDGSVLWRRWGAATDFTIDQWQNSAGMIPVNPDRDNHVDVFSFVHSYELAYRYWNGVELVDHPGWPKNFYPFLPTPPVVGDIDGDGAEEVIIGTYDPSRNPSEGALLVFSLAGELKWKLPVPGGLKHIPALADVNGDGYLDVVFRSLVGRVSVWSFGATTRAPVSWRTHRGNFRRDGNLGVSLFPAGTPQLADKSSGARNCAFSWNAGSAGLPDAWQIFRSEGASGPFVHLATLTPSRLEFRDENLKSGALYVYEVGAVRHGNLLKSAPIPMTTSGASNLIQNAGFEENDNNHWDKWYSRFDFSDMSAAPGAAHTGASALQIVFRNQPPGYNVSQNNHYGISEPSLRTIPGTLYSFGGWFRSAGLSAPSEHWLEWSSTPTAEQPGGRPSPPWPESFTPHWVAGTNETDWVYANRTFLLPDGFPNIEFSSRFSTDQTVSGIALLDDLFWRALPPLESADWTPLVPFGATWRFSTGPVPVGWMSPSFDDGAFQSGRAKFGAGSGPRNVATTVPPRSPVYFFRIPFVLSGERCEELLLAAACTRGASKTMDLFLNGEELATSGIDVGTEQGNTVRYFDLAPFADRIHTGTNILAVALYNTMAPDWDDVAFDLSLLGIEANPSHVSLGIIGSNSAADGNQTSLELKLPPHSIWQLETSASAGGPVWQPIQVITNETSGVQTRAINTPPNSQGFFRLEPWNGAL